MGGRRAQDVRECSGFFGFLGADVIAHEEAGDKGGQAAGDLLGVELFQQGAVGDVGGDDGGQLGPQPVVQQAVQGADEKAGIELGAQIVQDEQVGTGGGLEQSLFLTARIRTEM